MFLVPGCGPAFLGMPDIDNLGVLTINCKTIGRQFASDNKTDNRKRNHQCEKAVQTKGGMSESCTNKMQDVETQSQHNADNTTEPSVIGNQTDMCNNNDEKSFPSESTNEDTNSFFSELIINETQSFVSEHLREDDMPTTVKQVRDSNNSERFILDQPKDPDIGANKIQTKKKRKQKEKNNLKIDISESNRHRC